MTERSRGERKPCLRNKTHYYSQTPNMWRCKNDLKWCQNYFYAQSSTIVHFSFSDTAAFPLIIQFIFFFKNSLLLFPLRKKKRTSDLFNSLSSLCLGVIYLLWISVEMKLLPLTPSCCSKGQSEVTNKFNKYYFKGTRSQSGFKEVEFFFFYFWYYLY